jgi:chemotaxis-related protein WspB
MLMLLFYINNERYALPSQQVLEVIPLVNFTQLPHTPEYVVGVFNYRDSIVPVMDLSQFIAGKPCCEHLSTRIILVKCVHNQSSSGLEQQEPYILGLMAERVVETLHVSEAGLVDVNLQIGKVPYVGKMILDEQGIIQYLPIDYLLSEAEKLDFLPAG